MATVLTKPVQDNSEEAASREWRWTSEKFYRAASAGVFDDPTRLELIHGRIIEKMPGSPLHTSLTNIIADVLRTALTPLTVRMESAVHLAFDEEPIPDISVVTGANQTYLARHPAPEETRLVVEVSITTQVSDLKEKALLYAQSEIPEYWVVLPETQTVVVHREPTLSGYASVRRVNKNETLTPLTAPDAVLIVQEMFGLSRLGEEQ